MTGSVASGSVSSGSRPGTSGRMGGQGGEHGIGAGNGKEGTKTWTEGDYAYEYVPIAQRREGREKIKYEMTMRQQPVQARMCGVGEKSDRRPVDPTPIVQLKVIDPSDDPSEGKGESSRKSGLRRPESSHGGMSFMQNPYYFLFACLVGGDEQEDELHVIDDGKTRFLTGTPVSSLYHLKDTDNSDAAFFVFPDLGVRKEGKYKLKLTLFEIVDQEVFYCTTIFTKQFDVYSAKKFPGMQKATDLSKTFADQGLKIRVRKDPRQKRGLKVKRKSSVADSDGESVDTHPKRSRMSLPPQAYDGHGHPHDDHRHRDHAPYPPNNGYYHHPQHPHQYPPMPPPPMPYDPYRPPPPGYGYPAPYPPHHPHAQGRPVTHPAPPVPSRPHHSMPPHAYPDPPPHSAHHYAPPPSSYRGPPPPGEHQWPRDRSRERERDQRHPYPAPHHRPSSSGGPPGHPDIRAHRERDREREMMHQPPPLRPIDAAPVARPRSSRPITPIVPSAHTADRAEHDSSHSRSRDTGSKEDSRASSTNGHGSSNTTATRASASKDGVSSPSGSSQKTNRMGLGHLVD